MWLHSPFSPNLNPSPLAFGQKFLPKRSFFAYLVLKPQFPDRMVKKEAATVNPPPLFPFQFFLDPCMRHR